MLTKQLEIVKHKLSNIQQVKSFVYDKMQESHWQYQKLDRLYGNGDMRVRIQYEDYKKMFDLWSQLDDLEKLLNDCLIKTADAQIAWDKVGEFENSHH